MLYDKDIRIPLFEFLEMRLGKCRIFEEKIMGKSRSDVLVITEKHFIGLEIKSDADKYTRLDSQIKEYDKYCDYNYVVVGGTHGRHIEEHVPSYWGIITVEEVDSKIDFYILREPTKNDNVILERKLSILWRPELAHIQQINGMHKYANNSKIFVIQKILDFVDKEVLEQQINEELFERDYTLISDKISEYRKNKGQKPRRAKRKTKKYRIL